MRYSKVTRKEGFQLNLKRLPCNILFVYLSKYYEELLTWMLRNSIFINIII
jgi:hypothetical protein